MAAHNSLCTNHILLFGNETQKQTYLPRLATGEWIGAWGLTEPNTGSDAGNMRTTAVPDGDYWIINGAKNFITHGKSGNVAVVVVRTGAPNTSRNASAFVIEKGTPGFSAGKKEDKLGMRASETTELIFQDCRVHKSQMLGEVGDGFVQALKILDGGRILIAGAQPGYGPGRLRGRLAVRQGAAAVSASPFPSSRPFPSSWPKWPPKSKRPSCSPTTPPNARTTAKA
jgi:alkylation response protein AidB-like acyl-CoA dehydrogenase